MIGTRARLGIGTAAAAVMLAAVAGCSGGGGGAEPQSSGSAASAGTFLENPAAVSAVSGVMHKANAAGAVAIAGTVTSPTTGKMTISGEEQYSPTVEMSMSMRVEGETMSEVLIGSKFYMDYPALSAQMGGKPWGEFDLAGDDGKLGSLSSLADTTQEYNPTTQLAALIASGTITDIGPETDQGRPTEHYHGQLVVAQMLQDDSSYANLLTAGQIGTLESVLKAAGVTKESVDVWVGANGLPVEIKYETEDPLGQIVSDMVLSGWGKPVQVGAPPASQVFDLTAQIAAAESSATASPGI